MRVKLVGDGEENLKAFCSITIDDDFVVRDLKVIAGHKGTFVAMPSRKLADKCPKCGGKNHLRASYCSECGARLSRDRARRDEVGKVKLHADIAHPINSACREEVQRRVLEAYEAELERSAQPGYMPHGDVPGGPEDDCLDYLREPFTDGVEDSEAGETAPAPRVDGEEEQEEAFGAGIFG